MKRKRKIFALTCLGTMLFQTFSPLTALALTSGPVSTDASSFEPVDTSTMVNPVTGGFVYNLPLLEVPGPEGSYPLSLSYHAGINPEQESSWVGLGWTLNPGAISRSVNGFPDDWANNQASRRDYWAGGVTNITSVGVTVPIHNFGSINLGLIQVSDTYAGVGYGWNAGVTVGIGGEASPFSGSVGIGSNPFSSGLSVTGGVGMSFAKFGNSSLGLSGSVGENNSIGISAGSEAGILGASLSTDGGFAFSAPGYKGSLANSKDGQVRTQTRSTSLNLILFKYSNTRTRYWTDETETSNIYGTLNANQGFDLPMARDVINDSYHLTQYSVLDEKNPEKEQGGAFPAFDSYVVTGQGIGGNIRPYMFQGAVTKQNVIERESANSLRETVQYGNSEPNVRGIGFRFIGDFSNTLIQNYTPFNSDASAIKFSRPPFSKISEKYTYGTRNYEPSNQNLSGSKSITYFQSNSNGNIYAISGQSDFIPPVAKGLDRAKHAAPISGGSSYAGIAGFAITNESGVTYHYNLPAYNYDEESYQENSRKSSGLRFNRQTKSAGYAYTWHLTAITGPDYVDRGTPGVLDDSDYGYWVSFEYGKWNDQFVWRTPSEGFMENFDQDFNSVSMGKKEVYYLNSIRTRTHTALFEKDVRTDGKSASVESFNKNWSSQNNVSTDYSNQGVYNINSTQSLRLSHVYILKNGTFSNLGTAVGGTSGLIPAGRTVNCTDCELPNNILDMNDINVYGRNKLESNSLRVIDLNYDYSLAKGSTTSFNFASPITKLGKLTLKSMKVRGKGGVSHLPATEFGYNLSTEEQKVAEGIVDADDRITYVKELYEIGDLIETDSPNPIYYGYVQEIIPNGDEYDYIIKGGNIMKRGLNRVRRTKNPPFQKNKYDYWGMFKSDYFDSTEKNINRTPTRGSIKSTDVWSLRKIKTMTGAIVDIGYEGHDFKNSLYSENRSIWFDSMYEVLPGVYRIQSSNIANNCKNFFKVGDKFNAYFFRKFLVKVRPSDIEYVEASDLLRTEVNISNTASNYIEIKLLPGQVENMFHVGDNRYDQTQVMGINFSPTPLGVNTPGGSGVRVVSMTMTSIDGVKNNSTYSYNGSENSGSSGSVIYEPLAFEKFRYSGQVSDSYARSFTSSLNPEIDNSVKFANELPGPSVMYGRVETASEIIYPDGAKTLPSQITVSEFFSFPDLQISLNDVTQSVYSPGVYSTRNLLLRKFVTLLGSPKSISYFDGNGKLTKRILKQYLHNGVSGDFFANYKIKLEKFGYQGLLAERFSEVKNVFNNSNNTWETKGTMTAREDYPLVNIGTVEYNYIHNTKTSTQINAFDFFSGSVTESINTDSYGNSFLTKNEPAYHNYYDMAPSQLRRGNKNMLIQIASSNTYRLNNQGAIESLVSANYNVWSNKGQVLNENGDVILQDGSIVGNGNVWRQTTSYIWMPSQVLANGMIDTNSFVAFPFTNPSTADLSWKINKKTSLMDPYSHELSMMDFKGNHVSTRYGYRNTKTVLGGTFAKYGEIAFSGAEDENISNNKKFEVKKGGGVVAPIPINAHTGQKSLALDVNKTGFEYSVPVSELTIGRTYTVAVWVAKGPAKNVKLYYELDGVQKSVSASSLVSTKVSGNWVLVNFDIKVTAGTQVKVYARNDGTEPVFIDDFRFHPKNSSTVASVYDENTGELTHTLNQYNLFTRYEYNAMGQLVATYVEQFGRAPYKSSESQLNYSTKSFIGLGN